MAKIKLSGVFLELSGKMGNIVFNNTKEGTIMKDRVDPANPNTAAQVTVRTAFRKVAKQWQTLNPNQLAAWRNYASQNPKEQKTTGKTFIATGFNWFVALGTRYLLVNPNQNTAPTAPPATSYAGDTITVTAAQQGVNAAILFTASAANAAGTTTEFLVQPLKNAARTPARKGYRSKGFFTFVTGTLTRTIQVTPGTYSVAYCFVNTATGQESTPVVIGTIAVNGPSLSKPKPQAQEFKKAA